MMLLIKVKSLGVRCSEASQWSQDPYLQPGWGRWLTWLSCWALILAWTICGVLVTELVNALPVVDLGKNRHREVSLGFFFFFSNICLGPFPNPTNWWFSNYYKKNQNFNWTQTDILSQQTGKQHTQKKRAPPGQWTQEELLVHIMNLRYAH